jgi:hypothetical protein
VGRRWAGGVLAALCVAAGALGTLAVGLLAPPHDGGIASGVAAAPARGSASAPEPLSPRPAGGASSAETFVSRSSGLAEAGEATASGCAPALAYLRAYAAPGFSFECPGYADGHQAMTKCVSQASPCSVQRLIVIADPCPDAYMNEASNSWALTGASDAPLDPYGSCA